MECGLGVDVPHRIVGGNPTVSKAAPTQSTTMASQLTQPQRLTGRAGARRSVRAPSHGTNCGFPRLGVRCGDVYIEIAGRPTISRRAGSRVDWDRQFLVSDDAKSWSWSEKRGRPKSAGLDAQALALP